MRLHEFLPPYLERASAVIDVTHEQVDLREDVPLTDGARYRKYSVAEACTLDIGPDTVLLSLFGPDPPAQTDLDQLAPVLRRLRPGARAVLLLGWPAAELPYSRLLGPLVDGRCKVIDVVPLDPGSVPAVTSALIVECVPGGDAEQAGAAKLADELSGRVEELSGESAVLQARLRESRQRLASAESKLASLESSNSVRFGRAVVHGLHHPARGVVGVPKVLARMWRVRGATKDRVVPIALPAVGAHERELITMTLPVGLRIPRLLAQHGLAGYEGEALACFLAATDVAGPGAVFDIGANVGIYAALAAALTQREVRAFEPMPSLVEAARRVSADNQLRGTTELLALGAQTGSATLYVSLRSDTSNSLAAGFRESSAGIEVPVETLDSYVARTGVVPAVMKVDTETTEPDVLAGAASTIRQHRPWILCEVLAGRVEDRLTEVLEPFGYRWYHVTGTLPYEQASQIVGDRTYSELMWLFAPHEPGEDFWAAVRARAVAIAECTPERAAKLRAR